MKTLELSRKMGTSPTFPMESGLQSPRFMPMVRKVIREILKLEFGRLTIELPNGATAEIVGEQVGPSGHLTINSYKAIWAFLSGGTLGFSEAYVAGHWDSPNKTELLEVFVANRKALVKVFNSGKLIRPLQRALHARNRNNRSGSRRNIMAHYDLGNEFYEAWLDDTMTYSSAMFTETHMSLAEGQREKYKSLISRLQIQSHHNVLEIGCGWGGFAIFAAKTVGCKITTVTISSEQYDYVLERIEREELGHLVEVRICDYRDLAGHFDRVVSIEMVEAVGEAFWPTYFVTLKDRLIEGGRAGLQVITMEEDSFDLYRRKPDFIQRHIFPGGMLLSQNVILEQVEEVGLANIEMISFGSDYGRTLGVWSGNFESAWPRIRNLGFDERFKRLWLYYLSYCQAGFRGKSLDVLQVTMEKPMLKN